MHHDPSSLESGRFGMKRTSLAFKNRSLLSLSPVRRPFKFHASQVCLSPAWPCKLSPLWAKQLLQVPLMLNWTAPSATGKPPGQQGVNRSKNKSSSSEHEQWMFDKTSAFIFHISAWEKITSLLKTLRIESVNHYFRTTATRERKVEQYTTKPFSARGKHSTSKAGETPLQMTEPSRPKT